MNKKGIVPFIMTAAGVILVIAAILLIFGPLIGIGWVVFFQMIKLLFSSNLGPVPAWTIWVLIFFAFIMLRKPKQKGYG